MSFWLEELNGRECCSIGNNGRGADGETLRGLALNWLFRASLEHASEDNVNWIYQPGPKSPGLLFYM